MACVLASGEPRGWEWGQVRGWETRAWREGQHLAGSGRRWLSRLKAGTPLNLHHVARTGKSCLASRVKVKRASLQQMDGTPIPTVNSF